MAVLFLVFVLFLLLVFLFRLCLLFYFLLLLSTSRLSLFLRLFPALLMLCVFFVTQLPWGSFSAWLLRAVLCFFWQQLHSGDSSFGRLFGCSSVLLEHLPQKLIVQLILIFILGCDLGLLAWKCFVVSVVCVCSAWCGFFVKRLEGLCCPLGRFCEVLMSTLR